MIWRMTSALAFLAICGQAQAQAPQTAEAMAEDDALLELLGPAVAKESATLAVKVEPASIFQKPYLADDTKWEKAARTAWYAAQLPYGFPGDGNVSVIYLPRCAASGMSVDWIQSDEWTDPMVRAAEKLRVQKALATNGAGSVDVPLLQSRGRYSWNRSVPDPALAGFNAALQAAKTSGATATQFAVLEPFCPNTQRGSYEQDMERYERTTARRRQAGRAIPPPPPPPPSPPPPPPPPSYASASPPVQFLLPPATTLWIATEMKAQLCEIRYKTVFDTRCGWNQVYGSFASITGRHFRFHLEKAGASPRSGKLDLQLLPRPINLGAQ